MFFKISRNHDLLIIFFMFANCQSTVSFILINNGILHWKSETIFLTFVLSNSIECDLSPNKQETQSLLILFIVLDGIWTSLGFTSIKLLTDIVNIIPR